MTMYAPLPGQDLLPMELPESTSSRADSRAKTLVTLGTNLGLTPAQDPACTLKSLGLLASYDQISSFWKTSQHCFLALPTGQDGGLAEFSGTWPRSGLMRNGTAYALEPLDFHKSVTGFGYWPTPTKSDGKRLSLKLHSLTKRVRFTTGNKWNYMEHAAETLDGFPSPELGEWVMGYPRNWTLPELKASEIL
jgi:hypothetical protein